MTQFIHSVTLNYMWVAAADSSMWKVWWWWCCVYLTTTGCLPTKKKERMTKYYSFENTFTKTWAHSHFLQECSALQGDQTFILFRSQGSSSLYPPVFVKVLLKKSIRTRHHRVWLPSVGTQMAWPHPYTDTDDPDLAGVLSCLGSMTARSCPNRSEGGDNGEELPGEEKHHNLTQTDSFNQHKPKMPPIEENVSLYGKFISEQWLVSV